MAEHDFEMSLDRMFAEAPAFPDAELFAIQIDNRLSRGWAFRRMVIGGFGMAGGLIGGAQLLSSNTLERMNVLALHSRTLMDSALSRVLPGDGSLASYGFTVEVIWMSAALAAVAVGLAVTRLVREI
jgi:hypothetical protein